MAAEGDGLTHEPFVGVVVGKESHPVRVHPRRTPATSELSQRVQRLDQLPVRALTARTVMGNLPAEHDESELDLHFTPKMQSICQIDPGWTLTHPCTQNPEGTLAFVARSGWWPAGVSSGPAGELIGRLWRHSAFVSLAARSLAKEANDPDPEAVGRAGLLCRLGWWAVAAIDADWLIRWWRDASPADRRQRELRELGTDLSDLGRRLAERWGCNPLIVDASWLHGAHGAALLNAAAEPAKLAYIQQATRWAERTPWSFESTGRPPGVSDEPRLRALVAEVQARTASAFSAPDATAQEERMTRQNARLRVLLAAARRDRDRGARFLEAMADCVPGSPPNEWAARSAKSWCAEPGVSAARLVWTDQPPDSTAGAQQERPAGEQSENRPEPGAEPRPPAVVLPLAVHGKVRAEIQLWTECTRGPAVAGLIGSTAHRAWQSWAALVADRNGLERKIQTVVEAVRQQIDSEEARLEAFKLDALAEFAAGAGHELNNPLAVVVGRAQLLLARTNDPETARSLRIILSQAGRAHRILRDLIFVARPSAPRPRPCRPADLLRATLRDLQEECTVRGIRLVAEIGDLPPTSSIDPDALRHLADSLLRNAIEATPNGGRIVVRSNVRGNELWWSVADSGGPGISPADAAHLFDPFYCGRQAGRGLGLGLPRAARMAAQAGGRVQWSSSPGHETVFHVHLPLSPAGLQEKAGSLAPSPGAVEGNRSPLR